jgi:phage-related minor tail protein
MTEDMNAPLDLPAKEAEDLKRTMGDIHIASRQIASALSDGLTQAVRNGKALDAVFRSIALSLSDMALKTAMGQLEKGLAQGLGSLATGLASSLLSPGKGILPFAKGGVVASPTYFPLGNAGGGSASTGLMGEAGAEAILPLARDAHGRLGVSGAGNAAMPPIVFNVETRDAESFARSEAQIQTMVARAVGRGRRGL